MGRVEKRSVAADVCVRNIGQIIGEQVMYKVLYVACFSVFDRYEMLLYADEYERGIFGFDDREKN